MSSTLIIVCCGVGLFLLSIPFAIVITNIQWNQERKKEDVAQNRLTNVLKNLCNNLNIPLTYHDDLGDSAGQILYHSNKSGRLILDDARIQILKKHENEPYVLAHELGHYMAIKQQQDRSEESADREALLLCKSILTQEEQSLMEIGLHCHFEYNAKKDKINA
jgi:hypothetical protein